MGDLDFRSRSFISMGGLVGSSDSGSIDRIVGIQIQMSDISCHRETPSGNDISRRERGGGRAWFGKEKGGRSSSAQLALQISQFLEKWIGEPLRRRSDLPRDYIRVRCAVKSGSERRRLEMRSEILRMALRLRG